MMDIRWAAEQLKAGKIVARRVWKGHCLRNYPPLKKPLEHEFPLSISDIMAKDWVLKSEARNDR